MCMYIYIYIYSISLSLYIYIERERYYAEHACWIAVNKHVYVRCCDVYVNMCCAVVNKLM